MITPPPNYPFTQDDPTLFVDLINACHKLVWYIETFHPNAPSRSPEREMLTGARALIARAR